MCCQYVDYYLFGVNNNSIKNRVYFDLLQERGNKFHDTTNSENESYIKACMEVNVMMLIPGYLCVQDLYITSY